MGKRIVGYVISHSGKPGGPWECEVGPFGHSTDVPSQRMVWGNFSRYVAQSVVDHIRWLHPAARILRLVRRERHRAEESAVVEAAMAWESATIEGPEAAVTHAAGYLLARTMLLRAKRGG